MMTNAYPQCVGKARFNRNAGFTLMELMIVVAIVGILAALALSGYQWAMVKGRRAAAEGCLQEHAQYMERFFTTNMAYDKDPSNNASAGPTCTQDKIAPTFYTVRFVAGQPTATTYAIEAVPTAAQHDTLCGTLTIDNKGVKTESGTGSVADCW